MLELTILSKLKNTKRIIVANDTYIHVFVERVIGVLKRRFHILNGPVPILHVKTLSDEIENRDIANIDKIVHVCAALVNMSGSIVLNTNREGDS